MTNLRQRTRGQLACVASVLGAMSVTQCATAQVPTKQWPGLPVVVAKPGNDPDLIPRPILPPDPKPPGSDPLLSVISSPLGVTGTLAYFARAWDGGQAPSYSVIVLRSLGGSRLLPERHLGIPGLNLRSESASYGFHEGEYGSGNPQFSPDGQVLLYEQSGFMPQYGSGRLYEWDMKTGRVRQLTPDRLAYLNFFWAPDSQSVAYVTGGLETGKPAQLCIVDRRTLRRQSVVLPEGVSLLLDSPTRQQGAYNVPIAWSSSKSVLLTGVAKARSDVSVRPDIYEATNGKAHLLVPQAYAPIPSRDGKWIACFGWPDAQSEELKQQPPQSGPNIYLYDRSQKKRFFVRALPKFGRREVENRNAPPCQIIQWTPDSRRLIVMETPSAGKQNTGEATATISTLAIPSQPHLGTPHWAQELRPITTLRMSDFTWRGASPIIHYGPLQVSSDGNHLFLSALQATDGKEQKTTCESSLLRVNLANGQVDVLARFNTDRLQGFDWHEEQK